MRLVYPLFLALTVSPALSKSLMSPAQPPSDPQKQAPLMPVIPKPETSPTPDSDSSSGLLITDALARDRSINLFAGFTRDIESVGERLDDSSQNATVLCPVNAEIQKLPRKPWEDPKDYEMFGAEAYDGKDGEDRAHRNYRRFVEAHVVPVSPWKEGEKVKALAGNTLWYEEKDGKKVIQPGNIEVIRSEEAVDNGEVWVLQGVINYAVD